MAILTHIQGIPLFQTPSEAISWGRQYGLTGYHSHMFNIRTGYMAGFNHNQATVNYQRTTPQQAQAQAPVPIIPPEPIPTPQPLPTPPPPTQPQTRIIPPPTSGGGSGY